MNKHVHHGICLQAAKMKLCPHSLSLSLSSGCLFPFEEVNSLPPFFILPIYSIYFLNCTLIYVSLADALPFLSFHFIPDCCYSTC